MGQHYGQLSLEERCEITRLQASGCSLRKIAKTLGRSASTISRELNRNTDRDAGYRPAKAQSKADQRCWRGARLDRDPKLREAVLACLAQGWSPEQTAGRLARRSGRSLISHESIYRFIYAQMRRSDDRDWRNYLPRAKARRGRRGRKGGSSVKTFKDRVPIAQRPRSAASRLSPGHWEADLMAFSRCGQNILLAHERKTRILLLARQPSKHAARVVRRLGLWFAQLPPQMRKTITFDNGTEFALHHQLTASLGVKTYFCDPHSPWQKGGIENAIGRMRKPLPRKTDLASLDLQTLQAAAARYNNTPRKCLGWKTPAEAFSQHLKPLHFKCESTLPPAREMRRREGAEYLAAADAAAFGGRRLAVLLQLRQ
ncbi:MAG TPA: IS30 family transposase [Hyphomonadaceae bacterium]|nr:IS30 family transposase [Hyphomonadaceae bacterium]